MAVVAEDHGAERAGCHVGATGLRSSLFSSKRRDLEIASRSERLLDDRPRSCREQGMVGMVSSLVRFSDVLLAIVVLLLILVKVRDVRVRKRFDRGFWEALSSPPPPYAWQTWVLIGAGVLILLLSGDLL